MAIMDKLKDLIGIPEEDEQFDEEEVVAYDAPRSPQPDAEPGDAFSASTGASTAPLGAAMPRASNNKVVNIAATTQLQVVLVKPVLYEEAGVIAEYLNARHTVVLNLESADIENSRRLLDFLSGVAFANKGQVKRVANNTYIITPYNVNFMGDLLDELENNGIPY